MSAHPHFPECSVLDAARKRLALRGPVGFFSLSRRLRSLGYFRTAACSSSRLAVITAGGSTNGYNGNGNGKESGPFISIEGFKEALSEIGCGLTDRDLSNIFVRLDEGGRGEVCYTYFLSAAVKGVVTFGVHVLLEAYASTRVYPKRQQYLIRESHKPWSAETTV